MLRVITVCLLLCGCAAQSQEDAHIYPGLYGQKIVGNEAYVTIFNVYNEMDALPLAEKHCRKYGKAARFTRMQQMRAVFDCVSA